MPSFFPNLDLEPCSLHPDCSKLASPRLSSQEGSGASALGVGVTLAAMGQSSMREDGPGPRWGGHTGGREGRGPRGPPSTWVELLAGECGR